MAQIIKAGGWRTSGSSVQSVAFDLPDIANQADAYLDQVRHEAAKIVGQAKRQAEAVRSRAEEQGHDAAVKAAEKVFRDTVQQQLETLLPALNQAIEAIHHEKDAWLKHWEKRTVHLAAAIAERIIRRRLPHEPEITLDLITEALGLAAGSAEIKLHLNPNDYQTLGQQAQTLAARLAKLSPTDIIADPAISPGGCRIETKFGAIDQQFESQLDRIEEELT